MESHIVRVYEIMKLTHDVLGIKTEKPKNYTFVPGQATEVAINQDDIVKERRPFTFTNLPGDDHLEFIIKTYPAHNGVTNRLLKLSAGDELIIHDVWGAISYKGRGLFIAGGAGITPFISIFRQLASQNRIDGNRLLYANKTSRDIILNNELMALLNNQVINILSHEISKGYRFGFIREDVLKELVIDKNDVLYLCGPPAMTDTVLKILDNLGLTGQMIVMEV